MKRVTLVLSLAAVVGLVVIATGFAAEGKAKRKPVKGCCLLRSVHYNTGLSDD